MGSTGLEFELVPPSDKVKNFKQFKKPDECHATEPYEENSVILESHN